MRRRRITFLIGAHKTATTHLQRSLQASAKPLMDRGIAAIGPMPLGADLIPFAELAGKRTDHAFLQMVAEAFLSKYCDDAPHALLMNENIMGQLRPKPLLRGNRLYAPAPDRLERLCALFPDHDLDFGMAIRNPADFLVSAWGEDMKGGTFYPFRDYIRGVDLSRLGWADLVIRLQRATDGRPFTIWQYEEYPAMVPALLKHLLGEEAASQVHLKDGRLNPGLSADAVALLRKGGDAGQQAFKAAQAAFPKSATHPAFDPWDAATRQCFNASYARDIAAIRALPGVTIPG
ncbi:hypothetical protein [Primorskyibacter marinus]|uniref:hypothetical protein n=1 Tax=Primorskyibacter marinus TaxID=1977320 RepID=UPI000E302577|nr:hypothetical protein [Primorskyibacter marinus]